MQRWQEVLKSNFRDLTKLADFLELDEEQRRSLFIRQNFPLNLPLRLATKIAKRKLDDPILRQFVPVTDESFSVEQFVLDPLGESRCIQKGKLLHKYRGRVLLVCTSACAMHCRYCFRQHYPYETEKKDFQEELEYIFQDQSVREVILSGGDPLSLPDFRLKELFTALSTMNHVKRIRFHSRFPIGIPERIDDSFCEIMRTIKQQVWFVVHVNHPRELDEDVLKHLNKLQKAGAILLNQSVLLRGVNDSVDVLVELSEKLVDNGIVPYYLHQLDQVKGTAHFEVDKEHGKELLREMEKYLSGYALPKYAQEIAGEESKKLIFY